MQMLLIEVAFQPGGETNFARALLDQCFKSMDDFIACTGMTICETPLITFGEIIAVLDKLAVAHRTYTGPAKSPLPEVLAGYCD